MKTKSSWKDVRAVSRSIIAVVVVIIIIVAGAGVYFATLKSTTSTTTTPPTSSSSSSSSTPPTASSTTSVAGSSTTSSAPPVSTTTSSSQLGTTTASSSTTVTTSQSQVTKNNLTIDEAFWPSYNLNVLLPGLTYPNWMEYDMYQPLDMVNVSAEYGNQGYHYLPGLALNWTVSPNGTVYTFNLRQGVTFSNGDPFNSYEVWMNMYDVYYSIFNSTFFFGYPTLFNVSNIVFGPSTIAMINASGLADPSTAVIAIMSNSNWPIYVNGPNQIVFRMTSPFENLLGVLDGLPGQIFDAQFGLQHGWPALYGSPAMGYFASNPIPGTGPYMMTQYAQNSYVSFEQNPTYWGKNLTAAQIAVNPLLDPGHVKQVTIQYKPDDLSRYTDLVNNVAQISAIQSQDFPIVTASPSTYGWVTFPTAANIVSSLAFNTGKYPLNITDVRLAIEHAINYSVIYQNVFNGQITPYFGPEVPGFGKYYDVGNYSQYSFNVTLAQSLLAKAGLSSSNFPTLTFSMPAGYTVMDGIAQVVQSQLQENLGINVELQTYSYSQWIAPYNSGNTTKAFLATLSDITFEGAPSYGQVLNDPAANWITFTTARGFDLAFWSTNATNELANVLVNSNNQTLINSVLAQAQADVYNDAPYIWIGVFKLPLGNGSYAYKHSEIANFYYDPMWSGANTAPILNTITFTS
ncbi:MAG: ABC transporter substrate-binding protein [Nitrososphaerales archaeon]